MTTVLLTGFEPFAGDAVNPSDDAVRIVAERWSGPEVLVGDVLPVVFDDASARLRTLIRTHRPHVVIATGLAGGRTDVTPERVAINLADARIPDNAGRRPLDMPVVADGPAAYFSTLPVKAMVRAIRDVGVPASVSYSAGTFVCNHVMYTALHEANGARAGFVHVPHRSDAAPAGMPSLPLDEIVRALQAAVRAAIATGDDTAEPGGSLH